MRALVIAIILVFFGANVPSAAAQSTSAAVPEVPSAQLVERAERRWAEALVSKDAQELARALDQRFRLITVGAGSLDRDGYLRQQSDLDRAYRAMTPTNIGVSVNGNIAVAVVDMTVEWPERFQQRHRYWQFTDTWIRADDEWRAVVRVSQPVQPR